MYGFAFELKEIPPLSIDDEFIVHSPMLPDPASTSPLNLALPLESIKKFFAVIEPVLKLISIPASAKISPLSGPSQLFD
jgi:hypothetical protein